MKRNLRITIDGRSYDVVVEEVDGPAPQAAPAQAAPAAAPATAAPVAAPVAAPAPAAPQAAPGAGAIVAPLGGVVFGLDVQVGRAVAVGDRVATIEAMKMKTEVFAKIAGTVASVAVKVNESVETGQLLMTLA
ncbi:MAG TPA: biotin/lipoyl-containing protein [Acidisphaera sp.]|nr:biotin/lipoyl-containing protein [Acidisphaera sp.]